jgi:hypothetical protein
MQQDNRDYLAESAKAAELSHDERQLSIVRAEEQGYKAGGANGMLQNARHVQEKLYQQGLLSPFILATTCAQLGDNPAALHYLQIAYERHDPSIIAVRSNAAFSGLEADPAYRKLVSGLPPLT